MRSLHRAVVGGGFGVLAVAGIAGSVAFACTPQARLTADGANSIVVAPGTTVEVKGTAFNRDTGPVTFAWNNSSGEVLGRAWHENVPSLINTGVTTEVWMARIVIPADAVPGGQYFIIAFQNRADTLYLNQSVLVTIPRLASGTAPTDQVAPPTVNSSPILTATPGTGTAATPTAAPFLTPAPKAIVPAAASASSPTAVAPGASAPVTQTPAAVTPEAPAVSAETAAELRQPLAIPAPADIWSGLDRSVSATALLDAPAPTSSESQLPVGGILLGLGTLALAGTAVAASRQRVLAKASDQK